MIMPIPVSRRRFLATAAASTAITAVGSVSKPYLSRAADRPLITHGIQSGDVSVDSAVIWARADRPARMLAEVATTDSFNAIHRAVFVDALPESDFTAKVLVDGLPAGQDIFYRIRFQDLASPTIAGEPMTGHFRPGARSRSCGRATPPDRAGASTRRAAACAPTPQCCATGRISSSTAAIISTPTVQSSPSRKCRTARFGKTS
jgi:phosphodiesterase/alkaline phosphatase D-like protein